MVENSADDTNDLPHRGNMRESSTALTEDDDVDLSWLDPKAEYEDDDPVTDVDNNHNGSVAPFNNGEDEDKETPVPWDTITILMVPGALAASSIMERQ